MKQLCLIRHAKSDWGTEFLEDIHRPLNQRGYDDAYRLSQLAHELPQPDKVICSSSVRTYSTALILSKGLQFDIQSMEINPELYLASMEKILRIIASQDDKIKTLYLVGHNPGTTDLFNKLSEDFIDNVPTCGILLIEFPIKSWKEISKTSGKTIRTIFPRQFRS